MKKHSMKALLYGGGVLVAVSWIGALLALIAMILALYQDIVSPEQYITEDVSTYGSYIGNYNNLIPTEFITSFFPSTIEGNFSNVMYSYRAQKGDTFAFEAYLEFEIQNKDDFDEYIRTRLPAASWDIFRYESNYLEYVVEDVLVLEDPIAEAYPIRNAKIGKILYSPEQQRIVYVAIGVYDGGIVKSDFLNVYFQRFQINPKEYALSLG